VGTKAGRGRAEAWDGKRQGIAWHPKARNSSQKASLDLELITTGFRDNTKNKGQVSNIHKTHLTDLIQNL